MRHFVDGKGDAFLAFAPQPQELRIKSSPQKLIAQGGDWRFLKELKKEMKA